MILSVYLQQLKHYLQCGQMRIWPGVTAYPHRLVFIAGLPKSGTTWLENLIGSIPGYRRLVCYDPRNRLKEHVLDPVVIESLPVRGNFFTKTHVEARPEGVEALRQGKVPTVVMVRDLRDQCVSRFYHVLNEPAHRHHHFYLNAERAEAFSHCIEIAVSEYAVWIRDWLRAIQGDTDNLFLLLRYEDMRAEPKGEFLRVLKHFDIALDGEMIDGIINDVSAKAKRDSDLSKRLKRGGNTLRGGRIGDWRSHFSSSDVELFKASANDVLVSLGYEHDGAWQI